MFAALIVCGMLLLAPVSAKEKRLPSGDAANEAVRVEATCLDSAQLKETFGTDFDNLFAVIEVTITPKVSGKALDVHLDDFLIRSEQTGEHSGPLAASQIAGQGALVVHQRDNKPKSGIGFGGGIGGIMMGGGGGGAPPPEAKVEVKNSETRDPLLDVLKRKILAEKPVNEPVTGLLFFPLEKEKPKNLVLVYTTPVSDSEKQAEKQIEKLRIRFK
jgi:hypothetical protein